MTEERIIVEVDEFLTFTVNVTCYGDVANVAQAICRAIEDGKYHIESKTWVGW